MKNNYVKISRENMYLKIDIVVTDGVCIIVKAVRCIQYNTVAASLRKKERKRKPKLKKYNLFSDYE